MNAAKIFILIGLSLAVYLHSAEGKSRQKRALWDLYDILKNVANVDAFKGLIGHGNYCGWEGSGNPVDDLDRCCQQHDKCYGRRSWWSCPLRYHFVDYGHRCSGGNCYCTDRRGTCSIKACTCDLAFAKCVKKYRHLVQG